MAKRRKSRALSGTPEHHEAQRDKWWEKTRSYGKKALEEASSNNCRAALWALLGATGSMGRAEAHDGEVGGVLSKMDPNRFALAAFESRCLVKNGSVSGIRRRSRRYGRR